MGWSVKGALFVDYVRMIKSRKDVDWAAHLKPEELELAGGKIELNDWYPMESFERMGNAILREIAEGEVEAVRMWGRFSMDELFKIHESLIAEGDPRESFMRFKVLRGSFFNFEALDFKSLLEKEATIEVDYLMGKEAEKAASYQALGFFERILELSGARKIKSEFTQKVWDGDATTVVRLMWK